MVSGLKKNIGGSRPEVAPRIVYISILIFICLTVVPILTDLVMDWSTNGQVSVRDRVAEGFRPSRLVMNSIIIVIQALILYRYWTRSGSDV